MRLGIVFSSPPPKPFKTTVCFQVHHRIGNLLHLAGELLFFLKVFRTSFGSHISQSNYTRGEFSCLLLSIVGNGKCFLFSFFFLNTTGLQCGLFICAVCSSAQRHSALCWPRGNTPTLCEPTREAGRCARQPCVIVALIALSHLCLSLRRV